jgi:hypothetical protein
MFTKEEIERAKTSPSFPREYELQYRGLILTTKEDLNLYYQKIYGMQRRCQMVRINV